MSLTMNRVTLPAPLPQTIAAVEAAKLRSIVPRKTRGPGIKNVRRAVLIQQVARWYNRKLEVGTFRDLARELGVEPKTVQHIVQGICKRRRAQRNA